ncbi:MAG: bifunctional pyr operon transcriptional regulator/uracil phosphoribosyltransferase PyrR [Halodesulfovibrio sp.]
MSDDVMILSEEEMRRTLERLAYQVLERHGECAELCLVGIQRRGVDLAARLRAILSERLKCDVPLGALDINLYRDDWTSLESQPMINRTELPGDIDGKIILLVDDVLFTGRTIRAALEGILDFGRPRCVELLVLVDRGHRELPIHADYVGKIMNTARNERVDVLIKERDGKDVVLLRAKG